MTSATRNRAALLSAYRERLASGQLDDAGLQEAILVLRGDRERSVCFQPKVKKERPYVPSRAEIDALRARWAEGKPPTLKATGEALRAAQGDQEKAIAVLRGKAIEHEPTANSKDMVSSESRSPIPESLFLWEDFDGNLKVPRGKIEASGD